VGKIESWMSNINRHPIASDLDRIAMTSKLSAARSERIGAALLLMFLAPLVAEVLPGATTLSAIFVFPIEMCVWGGGALLIREAVRRRQLGWLSMLLLAVALAVAEEFVIQQTSLAPLVVKLKGEVYARAFGVNYLYLLWAVVYESVFVVFVPIMLVELILPGRRNDAWLNKACIVMVAALFVSGAFLAWFTWTRIAVPHVFKLPIYHPPIAAVAGALVLVGGLIYAALGSPRNRTAGEVQPLPAPPAWLLAFAAAIWAVLWFGLAVLAFGIAPWVPPYLPMAAGLAVAIALVYFLPRWTADPGFRSGHTFALACGATFGSMAAGFVRFLGGPSMDLFFKVAVNVIAVVLLLALGWVVRRRDAGAGF
jgi:hypothetical protein